MDLTKIRPNQTQNNFKTSAFLNVLGRVKSTDDPPPPPTAVEGKIIKGTGYDVACSGTATSVAGSVLESQHKPVDTVVKTVKNLFADEMSDRQKNFVKARNELVKKNGLVTWISTTGDSPDDKFGALEKCTMTWSKENAEKLVNNKSPTDANLLDDNIPEIDAGLASKYQTNAIVNVSTLSELYNLIIDNSNGVPFSDLVINAHGSMDGIRFSGKEGWGPGNFRLTLLEIAFERLQREGLLLPGARIAIQGCSIAANDENKKILQDLSDKFGIEIVAATKTANVFAPNLSGYISFFPEKIPENLPVSKGDSSTGTGTGVKNSESTSGTQKDDVTGDLRSDKKSGRIQFVPSKGTSRFMTYLKASHPAIYNFIVKRPEKANRIMNDHPELSSLVANNWREFCRQFAVLMK